MKTLKLSLIAGALAVASIPGFAADTQTVLTSMQAPVMVNQGEAYIDAQDSMMLNAGDRLMVMQGGNAQIQFANGCVQSVRANEIVTVGTADSCMTAEAAGTYNQVGGTGGSGGGGGGPQGLEWLGVGAIAGVGGFIVYKALDDDDNDRGPASP